MKGILTGLLIISLLAMYSCTSGTQQPVVVHHYHSTPQPVVVEHHYQPAPIIYNRQPPARTVIIKKTYIQTSAPRQTSRSSLSLSKKK